MEELAANPALQAATKAEHRRFLTARKESVAAATKMLTKYLEWRKAVLPLAADQPRFGIELPEWMVFHGKARDQTPVVHVQGAMYDQDKGTAQQYANATAALFDEKLPRESDTVRARRPAPSRSHAALACCRCSHRRR